MTGAAFVLVFMQIVLADVANLKVWSTPVDLPSWSDACDGDISAHMLDSTAHDPLCDSRKI